MDELSLSTKTAKRISEHVPTQRCRACGYWAQTRRCRACQHRYCQFCLSQHGDCEAAPTE